MALPSSGYVTADISNPGSALTDFTVRIDLSRMPTDWWSAVDTSDGTKGRAAKDDGTELASDWIDFDDTAETGCVRVKWTGSLGATGTHTVRIYPPQAANTSYAAGDTYGQHNAYDSNWGGYWPNGSGTDRTTNGTDLTANGGVTEGGVSGQVGAATEYDGSDDYVNSASGGITGAGNRTIMAWVAPDDTAERNVFGAGNGTGAGSRFDVATDGGGLSLRVESGRRTWSGSIPTGSFEHIALVLDGTTADDVEAYQAGAAMTSTGSSSTTIDTANDDLFWGADSQGGSTQHNGSRFDGKIDEAQLHSTARSGAWVQHEYDQANDQATFWGTWVWNAGVISASLTDGLSLGDTPLPALTLRASLTDGLTVGDTLAVQAIYQAALADGLSVGDARTVQATFSVLLSEGLTVSDAVARLIEAGHLSATFTLEPYLGGTPTLAPSLAGSITMNE